METIVFSGEAFAALIAFIFAAPIAAKAAMLDAKLDPEPGEDETRVLVVREQKICGASEQTTRRGGDGVAASRSEPSVGLTKKRLDRSFCRRWLRAANYREDNIVRAIAGRPVDNCPRLTRAKRNLWRSLKEDHAKAAERKDAWRETADNYQNELDLQRARYEITANANYLATITIDDIECERAIIAVDSEGADGGPETVLETVVDGKKVRWPEHYSVLWGASGVGFTKDGRVLDLPSVWAGNEDKRPLDGIEAAELLLSLPDRYGKKCYFVAFSFSYDVTMLLKLLRQGRSKSWHYDRVWEICKRKDKKTSIILNNTIHIGDYSISYIKSKVLTICKLDKEPDETGRYPVLKRVTIYDTFGFYQTSFVQVVASLVPLGLATEEEVEKMRQNKARRGDFASKDWPLDRIKAYTVEELRKLSMAVTVLRKAAFDDGIRMNRLDGAGNLSAGTMRKHRVMRHYKGLMKKYNAGDQQLIGYHADFGGRIELVQQGFGEGGICYKYDEKSSYPHKCIPLPSMIDGFWVKREFDEFGWTDIENASSVSMFQVKWHLPERYVDANGNMQSVPFFALPYRIEGGGIRFFSAGWGWYFRDEIIFLKRWLETWGLCES